MEDTTIMKTLICALLIMTASMAVAAPNYVFVTDEAGLIEYASFISGESQEAIQTTYALTDSAVVVFVNKNQYENGFNNLPPGQITSAIAQSKKDKANYKKFKKKESAIVALLKQYINELRANASLPEKTDNDIETDLEAIMGGN